MAKKRTNSKTAEIAAPIRDFLKEAIKQKIRTRADQEALAKYLGQAPTSVTNLLKGEGGLDTWVAAISYCYSIKPEGLLEIIKDFQALVRKLKPSESDKIAAQINLPEAKRKVLFSALVTALTLDEDSNK